MEVRNKMAEIASNFIHEIIDSDLAELRNQFGGAEILRRKEKAIAVFGVIATAARLLAFAAVAAPSAKIRGKETAAGERTAQRSVNEYFQFKFGTFADRRQLFQSDLPFQNYPGKTEFFCDRHAA